MKKYHKKNRRCFAGALVSILFSTLFAVSLQFFKGDVLDHAVAGEAEKAFHYACFLIAFILCEVFCYFFYKQFCARYVTGCTKCLKRDVFESILCRSYVAYKAQPQGEYIAKYTSEADQIKDRWFDMWPFFWEIFFKILFVSAALFALDWRIALITIVLLSTPLYIPKIIEGRLQKAQTAYVQTVEETLGKVNDWLSGFEIIKNYSIEDRILRRFESANERSMQALLCDMQLGAVSQMITTLISYLSYFIVLVCATWLVLTREFTAGDFFVAIGMIDQLSYPLISLAAIIQQLVSIKPTCKSMDSFIGTPKESAPHRVMKALRTDIRFRDVTFAYENRETVLDGFDLTIRKGECCLLQGPSGCGKTTTVNLLLRYFDVNSGSIEIDGVPIREMDNPYDYMTVVRQDAVLFHDTLRNNLTMYQDIAAQKLIDALKSVGLEKYANFAALDSIVTEGGTNFSGGEKKRICLARALLRETAILILDEPLANLDSDNVQLIENLLLSIKDRTVIIVSHQFSKEKRNRFSQVIDFTMRKTE